MSESYHPSRPTCGRFKGCRHQRNRDGTYRQVHARRCPRYGWTPPVEDDE